MAALAAWKETLPQKAGTGCTSSPALVAFGEIALETMVLLGDINAESN